MLEVQHGVAVLERRDQQALRVVRCRRGDHLEPRHRREPRLDVLRVERARSRAASDRRPDHERHAGAPAPVRLRQVVHDLVEGAGDEVAELHLDHRHVAAERQADRGADGARLDDRRVAHARLAELGGEALGHLEDAAVLGDVLAEEHDPLVAPHRDPQGVADRVHVAQLGRLGDGLRRGRLRLEQAGREHVLELLARGRARLLGRERVVDERVDALLVGRAHAAASSASLKSPRSTSKAS